MKKKRKKKLNIKRTIIFILFIYVICYGTYSLFTKKISNIIINGNKYVSDSDIINISKLSDYPNLFKYSSKSICKKISKLELVNGCSVKKKINGTIILNIDELNILGYYINLDKLLLSDGSIIENTYNPLGIPIIVNEIDNNVIEEFSLNFSKVGDNILSEINEVSYTPTDKNKYKFTINMIDGNIIYVNSDNINILSKYNSIYASLGDKKGTIEINSNNTENILFVPFSEG